MERYYLSLFIEVLCKKHVETVHMKFELSDNIKYVSTTTHTIICVQGIIGIPMQPSRDKEHYNHGFE